jgi:glycerol kinase
MTGPVVLAIDQGTSSTRAIAFDSDWRVVASASRRLTVDHPRPGWAEQDPDAILSTVVDAVAEVVAAIGGPDGIEAVGLTNQGETVVAWDADDGHALAPAVLWQCLRSRDIVESMRVAGLGPEIADRTGLPLDPYFSAGKMRWLLDEVPAVRNAAESGRLRFGTVDAWLTARLGGHSVTDVSTASRTQLLNLRMLAWDPELIGWFGLPAEALPDVRPSIGDLGELRHPAWGGSLPLRAMLCDQQGALAGNACFAAGDIKATYGTGVFVLANAGTAPPPRPEGLLTTVAWSAAPGEATYAFDGGVFSAGSLLDWLEQLRVIDDGPETDRLAAEAGDAGGVRLLPALGGLGAPWWDADARAVISGLTAASTRAHVARAALDAIAQRVCDVVEAMIPSLPRPPASIRVDGGLSANQYLVQRQSDLLGLPLEVAQLDEATAFGVASMAAVGAGRTSLAGLAGARRGGRRVEPNLAAGARRRERAEWRTFVDAARSLAERTEPSRE